MSKQKWLKLGIAGTALLLLPRRSSWQQTPHAKNLSEKRDLKNDALKNNALEKATSKKDNSKTTSTQQTDPQHQNCDKNK